MSGKNPNELSGKNDTEKLRDLFSRTYKEQAIWILNGFWETRQLSQHAEDFWKFVNKHVELDTAQKANGCHLDEFNAHRFLESLGETLTVLAMREKLTSYGVEKVKNVPLCHYLMWKYNLKANEVANATQGSNPEELVEAQRLLEEVQAAFREVERSAAEAKRREDEALEAEAPFKIAQEELNRAIEELKAQEDAYANKTNDLKRKSEEGGLVQRNKAKAELEIHLKEDPLPLRKAKITTEAAERKADKLRAPFKAAREAAERAREEADNAVEQARNRLKEAEDFLEEVRKKPGQPYGALWWIDRELQESKRYLPKRK